MTMFELTRTLEISLASVQRTMTVVMVSGRVLGGEKTFMPTHLGMMSSAPED